MTQWTEERRRKQAETIRKHKPWEKSTGPRTERGKKKSAKNALKTGERIQEWDAFNYMFWLNAEYLRQVNHLEKYGYDALFATNELLRLKKLIKEKKRLEKDKK